MSQIQTNNQRIVINKGYEIIAFNVSEFLYAKADGNICEVYLFNKEPIKCCFDMKSLRVQMQNYSYIIDTHRSYLVNMCNVVRINTGCKPFVELHNQVKLPISRMKKEQAVEVFTVFCILDSKHYHSY